MRGILVFALMMTLIFIGGVVYWIIADYHLDRDVIGNLNRASYGRDANEIQGYLSKYAIVVKSRGWHNHHTAFVFKTPDNDVGLHIVAVENLMTRAKELHAIDHADMAYQVGMTDLNAAVDRISEDMKSRYFWRFCGGLALLIFLPLSLILAVASFGINDAAR